MVRLVDMCNCLREDLIREKESTFKSMKDNVISKTNLQATISFAERQEKKFAKTFQSTLSQEFQSRPFFAGDCKLVSGNFPLSHFKSK